MPPTHRVRSPLRRAARDDSGFTVVEALVSLALLGLVSALTVTALAASTTTSKSSGDRLIATNLAQQDLQAMQSLRWPYYPSADNNCVTVVDGTMYTLQRTVSTDTPPTPTPTPTPSASTSASASPSASPSATRTATTSTSPTGTATATGTGTGSATGSPTTSGSPSGTGSPTTSTSATTSPTTSPTPSTTPPAPRTTNAAPTLCTPPTATTTASATATTTASATATAASATDPSVPCPTGTAPNFDKRQYMIVSTRVSWPGPRDNSVTLKAVIAC